MGRPAATFRVRNRAPGNFTLIVWRAPRENFDRTPVTISCHEIRGGKTGVGPEYRVDETDTFKEFRPVERGNQAHAGNHVAYGHVHSRLLLVLYADNLIRRGALSLQPS